MQQIPNWIIKVVEEETFTCRNCKKEFNIDNLMSISVQESRQLPHKDYVCIGLYCGDCKELIIFEIKPMTLIDFAFEILDQQTSNKIQREQKDDILDTTKDIKKKKTRKKSTRKSNITSKEIDEVKKFLKPKDLLHEEFLIALGMLPEDIQKYNFKKSRKKHE